MRIKGLRLWRVALPLRERWRTGASEETEIESVVVGLQTDTGVGWGETAPHRAPLYSPEWARGVFHLLAEELGPRLLGADLATGEELQECLRPYKGNRFAKAGLDLALWDALARADGQPVWRRIGGRPDPVAVGADLGVVDSERELLAAVERFVEEGFERVKLKVRPGWGAGPVRAVRRAFPELVLHADGNSSFTLRDMRLFRELDELGLAMIEQPLQHDDLLGHARLQQILQTPICLDESINGPERARHALELGACRWVNIKVARVGGLTPALEVHRLCREAGVPMWMGSMLESALGQAPSLAMATLPGMDYPSDLFPSSRFLAAELAEPELALSAPSRMLPPEGPGFGFLPRPGPLLAYGRETVALGEVDAFAAWSPGSLQP